MNALLLYPEMPDTFYAMKHFMKVVGKRAAYPPLGLLTVAALLPQQWNKRVVDLNVRALRQKDLQWADLVFLSAMNVQEESVREIIRECKRSGKRIVAGGPLFTHEHDRFDEIDYFVLNEAEITLPPFLQDMERGIHRRIYRSSDFADVHRSPKPELGLVDMDEYLYAIVQYSRGCPYMCDFCDVTALFGRKQRTKTAGQIIEELEMIHRTGAVQLVLFADDNLIGNKKVLKEELLPQLIAWRKKTRPPFFFATQLTVNLADDERLMQLLLDAGFRHIFIGIETPKTESLKASQKNQNLRRNLMDDIHFIHRKGFIISGGFIVGFDTDDETIFERQVRFIQESGIPLPIVNILKAPPGTELYDRIRRENRLSKPFAFLEGDTNIVPLMDEKVLLEGFTRLIDDIYLPDKSYRRIRQFFLNYRSPDTSVKIPERYRLRHITMLFRTLLLMGVLNHGRIHFWKLLIWTAFYKLKYLDKALFYGIMMYQMHETCKTILRQVRSQVPFAHRIGGRGMTKQEAGLSADVAGEVSAAGIPSGAT